jgi:hypothetical protein
MEYKCICCGDVIRAVFSWNRGRHGDYIYYCENKNCVMWMMELQEKQVKELDHNRKLLECINPEGDLYYNISRLFTPKDGGND